MPGSSGPGQPSRFWSKRTVPWMVAASDRRLAKKLTAELSAAECDVNITGRTSLMKLLQRKDVSVYVDLTGLAAGTYKITPMVSLASKEMQTDLRWMVSLPEVTVTIKE